MSDKLLPDVIAPEGLQIAEAYLMLQGDSKKVAHELSLPIDVVDAQLKNPDVKGYINRQYNEMGFRNKFKVDAILDHVINKKLEEMEDTELGSSYDIMDILKMQQKMQNDRMKLEIEMLKLKGGNSNVPTNQTNVQNNFNLGDPEDEGYQKLMGVLLKG